MALNLRVDIYGDSFSCPCCKINDKDTFLDILSEQFSIDNTSLHGVGAHWCVERFMQRTSYGNYLLFFLPDSKRLSLEYLSPDMASQSSQIYGMMTKNNMDFPDYLDDLTVEEAPKIFKDYEGYHNIGMHRTFDVMSTSFILSKAKHYDKVLIWPSSGSGYPFRDYNYALEIPTNAYIVPKSLNQVSQREKNIQGDTPYFGKDDRSNHLSPDNHVILANQINKFFDYYTRPDIMKFKYEVQ